MHDDLAVDDVREYLRPHGIEVRELHADTSTAVLAAEACGTDVAAIVKSLLFWAGDEPVLVLVAGDRKLDARRLAREIGVPKVRMMTPEEARAVSGYAVGGVPPLAHKSRIRTLIDRHLLDRPQVWAAAGAGNAVFPVEPARLVDLTGAAVTEAAR